MSYICANVYEWSGYLVYGSLGEAIAWANFPGCITIKLSRFANKSQIAHRLCKFAVPWVWSHSCHRVHGFDSHYLQVAEHEQVLELRGVFLQAAVAKFHMSELLLDYPERMRNLGVYARLDALNLVAEGFKRIIEVQRLALALRMGNLRDAHPKIPPDELPHANLLVSVHLKRLSTNLQFPSVSE